MRIVIAGAGIGGLVVAQALVRAGDDVVVVERDPGVAATGGYRLHLDADACVVLREHLPPTGWERLLAGSARAAAVPRLMVRDHRLRLLATARPVPDEEWLLVDRRLLRRVLVDGVEDRICWSRTVEGFGESAAGVVARTTGGDLEADVMIGADGARSVVSEQLLGRPAARDLGYSAVAGRVPLALADGLADLVTESGVLAFGVDGTGVFLSRSVRTETAAVAGGVATEDADLVWSAIAATGRISTDPERLTGLLRRWDPRVRRLPGLSDPATIARFPFLAADPGQELMPWPANRVTALGDAVHAMPPTGGQGAATAVRDAGLLAGALESVRRGRVTVPVALADYQRAMTAYAPAAVAESLQPVRWMRMLERPAARVIGRVAFPVAAAVRSVGVVAR
ncbi:2-polyprenyl-6-methoxyphenol hydroxylase-like FAD-dependent oxidoreductase [Kribbella amoyensis]|uniref:2-polyprenyl-6-methoxyphenol hydroxylase-like FAD-dependent oxidoreductase n=1 Tax=Kribbella amoyensis TaxID=996641 RepID=A0A561C0H9_9ACTN|nr:FAD-dependent monooxygenase [Kribbella amoyensis]TWD84655.1 2-polyprenyl-6-methoxyphenol hydroxylase-like FAD-dependent oxidoreductase [Kribbella amoyensis]